jgi:antitoxin (DNA-binding transcriptional repressor) of toxin-antitoxin stability system
MNKKTRSPKAARRKPPQTANPVHHQTARSVSVRGLRKDWRQVKAMVARGAKVVVTDNGVPIMKLVPVEKPVAANIDWVGHLQKIRELAGGVSTGDNAVLEERKSYNW